MKKIVLLTKFAVSLTVFLLRVGRSVGIASRQRRHVSTQTDDVRAPIRKRKRIRTLSKTYRDEHAFFRYVSTVYLD